VRDVANALSVPPTRLYYHFNLLEEAGMITVVETRKVGAMVQKVYQSRARGFRPSQQLSKGGHEPHELAKIATGVVFDGARADAEEALIGHFQRIRDGESDDLRDGVLGRSVAFFTREEAVVFADRLRKFIEQEFDAHDQAEGSEYGLTYVFFPLAGIHTEIPR